MEKLDPKSYDAEVLIRHMANKIGEDIDERLIEIFSRRTDKSAVTKDLDNEMSKSKKEIDLEEIERLVKLLGEK